MARAERKKARGDGRLGAVVLAGGRSKRFRSTTSKVVHTLAGRELLGWVLEALRELHRTEPLAAVSVVVPPGGEVEAAMGALAYPFDVRYAVQDQPLGTGDAARAGLAALPPVDDVLVLAGDAPLVRPSSLRALVRRRRKADAPAALLSAVLDDPGSYGRVVRDAGGRIAAIVEAKDAGADVRAVREINASVYAFGRRPLERALPTLESDNAAGEYYLTDVVSAFVGAGDEVVAVEGDPHEALGANTRAEFEEVSRIVRSRLLDALMDAGVQVLDPATTYVDVGVKVGRDTVIYPQTFLEGKTRVGRGCTLGPSVRLVDTEVGDDAEITFAVAKQSRVGPGAEVGPFASLRPGTVLRRGAKAGTFVEMKAAEIGEGAKVPHLAYMGDVTVGSRTNIGAGTITCNYNPFELAPDGSTKHRTTIGDDAYVSSDTMLVAPVEIGDGAQTGAGSVVTRNVEPGRLAFGVPASDRGPAKQRPTRPGDGPDDGGTDRRRKDG